MVDRYQEVIERLSRAKRVLVITHVSPDGDALGSCAAMALAMRQKGIEAEVLLLSHLPRKYAFVFKDNDIAFHDVETGWPQNFPFEQFDLLLVLDTGTSSQLPGVLERIAKWAAAKIVIDHHKTQEDWADVKLVVLEAAAAGEIVARLLAQWQVTLTPAIATALFVAVASDTGWFQFANTRPETLRLAATLIEAGVSTDRIYQALYQNEKAQRVALQTRAMQSLRLLVDGRLAVMRVTRQDFEQTQAGLPDTENLINIPLQIATVEVAIFVVEAPTGPIIRMSLRSKGQVDVARFAEHFGGGGHARAAGLKLEIGLAEAEQRVVGAMVEQMGHGASQAG